MLHRRLDPFSRIFLAILFLIGPDVRVFAAPEIFTYRTIAALDPQKFTQEQAFAERLVWIRRTPAVHLFNRILHANLNGHVLPFSDERNVQAPHAKPFLLEAAEILRRTRGFTPDALRQALDEATPAALAENIPTHEEAVALRKIFEDVETMKGDSLLAHVPSERAERFRNFYAVYKTYGIQDWDLIPYVVWLEARLNQRDRRPAFVSPLDPAKDIQEWREVQGMYHLFLSNYGLTAEQPRKILRNPETKGAPTIRLLMCYPQHFSVPWGINAHMKPGQERVNRITAAEQWEFEVQTLLDHGAEIELIDQHPALADMVFTANGPVVDAKNRRVIVPRFVEPQRQAETLYFAHYFRQRGYEVLDLAGQSFWEGEGDTLVFHSARVGRDIRFGGYGKIENGFRSNLAVQARVAALLGQDFVGLELTDPRYYHLDTAFFPLDDGRSVLYVGPSATGRAIRNVLRRLRLWDFILRQKALNRMIRKLVDFGAFSEEAERDIQKYIENPIRMSGKDAAYFAANGLSIKNEIFADQISPALQKELRRHGFTVITRPQNKDTDSRSRNQFLLSGGCWKCLALILEHYTTPVFDWDIPAGTDSMVVSASERAAADETYIRHSGKPLVQWIMEQTHRIFGESLGRWVNSNSSSFQIADDMLAIFPPLNRLKRTAPRATRFFMALFAGPVYRAGVRWTMGHFLLSTSRIRGTVRRLETQGIESSICLVGEQATTDLQAQDGVQRMIKLLKKIKDDPVSRAPLQMPVKISLLVARFDSKNPDHIRMAIERLRSIVFAANSAGVEVVIDGERYKDRQAQLAIFKAVAARLPPGTRMGIAVQTYFSDAAAVIDDLVRAAAQGGYRLSVRLIKGAYYEEEWMAGASVYEFQDETDANFRAVTEQLMRYAAVGKVYPMIASMNAREQAWAYEVAQREGLAPAQWESQMLYGMQPALLTRMLARGQRVRLYLLFGDDVIQGSQYFSRRLPELVGPGARSRQDHDPEISIEALSAIAPVRPAAVARSPVSSDSPVDFVRITSVHNGHDVIGSRRLGMSA